MTRTQSFMIEHRTQALTTVFLTGRNNVDVIPLRDLGGLSMICRILTHDEDMEMVFGVIHGGTSEPLAGERAAEKLLNSRLRASKAARQYPFPVLVLLFSMQSDDGFFAWRMEPDVSQGVPILMLNERLTCEKATRTGLDDVVERIRSWYALYYDKLVQVK